MRPSFLLAGLLLAASLTSCDKAKPVAGEPAKPSFFGGIVDKLRGAGKDKTAPSGPVAPLKDDGSGPVHELAEADFPALVATPGKLVVVVFHADWCGPCQTLKPEIATVAGEFPGLVTVGRFNVDQAKTLAGQKGVSGIPDVRFYKDGKEVDKFVGLAPTEQVRAKFKQYTTGLTAAAPAAGTPAAAPIPGQPAVTRMKKDWVPPGMEKR